MYLQNNYKEQYTNTGLFSGFFLLVHAKFFGQSGFEFALSQQYKSAVFIDPPCSIDAMLVLHAQLETMIFIVTLVE